MRITLESDYALRILASMAEYDGVTDAKTISSNTSVTLRFTLKILNKLVQGGIVESFNDHAVILHADMIGFRSR